MHLNEKGQCNLKTIHSVTDALITQPIGQMMSDSWKAIIERMRKIYFRLGLIGVIDPTVPRSKSRILLVLIITFPCDDSDQQMATC